MLASFVVIIVISTVVAFFKVVSQVNRVNDAIIKSNDEAKEAIRASKLILEGAN